MSEAQDTGSEARAVDEPLAIQADSETSALQQNKKDVRNPYCFKDVNTLPLPKMSQGRAKKKNTTTSVTSGILNASTDYDSEEQSAKK